MSSSDRLPELWVCQLGSVPYREALELQQRLAEGRRAELLPDTLLLLEHPLVITRGRRSRAQELPLPEAFYRERNIDLVDVKRGGKLTCHAAGQLVGYPIMRVPDVALHLRRIEAALIATLAEEGLTARSRHEEGPDYTGVWVEDRKIASIGVHVARGVSTHGFALNACNDLEPFSWMIPCGLPDVTMTSIAGERSSSARDPYGALPGEQPARGGAALEAESSATVDLARLRRRLALHFCEVQDQRERLVSPERLLERLTDERPAPTLPAGSLAA
jgi:lipoyl(octanoyl) transferase